jgi:hypothetical protein
MLLNGSAYGRGKVRGTSGDTRTGEGKFKIVGSWNVWIFGLGKAIYLSFRFLLVLVPGLSAGGLFGHGLFVSNYFFASADLAPSLRVLARGLAFEGSNFHIEKQR